MCCCSFHEKAEAAIGGLFEKFGRFISKYPIQVIIIMVLVNGLLGIGMLRLETDIDVSRVYTPQGSQAAKDEEKILGIFPDKSAEEFIGYQVVIQSEDVTVLVAPNIGNILDTTFLSELSKIVDLVNTTTAVYNGETLTFDKLCARYGGRCVIDGDVFLTAHFLLHVNSTNVTYPQFVNENGVPVTIESLLGNAEYNQTTTYLTKATHLKLTFNLRSDSIDWIEKVREWQEKFIERMAAFSNPQFDFAYAHSDSLSSELNANIGGDIVLFSVTFTLMITFASFATYPVSNDNVGKFPMQSAFNTHRGINIIIDETVRLSDRRSHIPFAQRLCRVLKDLKNTWQICSPGVDDMSRI